MLVEDKIRDVWKRLIACEDEAQIRLLACKLRALIHQGIEGARSQIRCLPYVGAAAQGKKSA